MFLNCEVLADDIVDCRVLTAKLLIVKANLLCLYMYIYLGSQDRSLLVCFSLLTQAPWCQNPGQEEWQWYQQSQHTLHSLCLCYSQSHFFLFSLLILLFWHHRFFLPAVVPIGRCALVIDLFWHHRHQTVGWLSSLLKRCAGGRASMWEGPPKSWT